MQDPHKDPPPRAVPERLFKYLHLQVPERPGEEAFRQWEGHPATKYLLAALEHHLHRTSRLRRTSSDEGPNEWQRLEGRLAGIEEAMSVVQRITQEVIGE